MKHYRPVAALALMFALFGPLVAPGCAKAPPNLTPQAVAAFHGTQLIRDLDRLRDVAVDAHRTVPPLIDAEVTLKIVKWHEQSLLTVRAATTGWKSALRQSLVSLEQELPPRVREVVGPYLAVIRIIMEDVR